MYTWLILSWSALLYTCIISDIRYSGLCGTSKSSCGGTVQRAGSWEAGPHSEVIWTEGKRDVYWFHTCLIPELYNVGSTCWFHVVHGWYFHSDDSEEYCLLGCNMALHVWNVTVEWGRYSLWLNMTFDITKVKPKVGSPFDLVGVVHVWPFDLELCCWPCNHIW